MVGLDPFGPVTDKWLLAFGNDRGKLRSMSRPKKIKTAIWIGEQQWQALKELADTLDRSAAQLLREAIDLLLKKYGAK
jgi:hypothetical protein